MVIGGDPSLHDRIYRISLRKGHVMNLLRTIKYFKLADSTTYLAFGLILLLQRVATPLDVEELRPHRGESPPGNSYSPSPVSPSDVVHFVLNGDSMTYGNGCFQGRRTLAVDEREQSATIEIEPLAPNAVCTLEYDPVTGVEGEIGPLTSGPWTVRDTFGNSVQFHVGLMGDFDADGLLTVSDINALSMRSASGLHGRLFDLNDDQLVNAVDLTVWIKDLQSSWIGDANVDNVFNTSDLVKVFQSGKFEQNVSANWSEGDWNGDGLFDSGDLVTAFQDGGFEMSPQGAVHAVPEPLCTHFLWLGVFAVLQRRNSMR